VEERDRGQFEVPSWHLHGGTEENHGELHSRQLLSEPTFELGTGWWI